jgi:hypothetical protein
MAISELDGRNKERSTMLDKSLKETLALAAAWEGMPLNFSAIGKQLGLACPAAKARVQKLAEARMIWLLPALEATPAGRPPGRAKVRKSPKLYLRESAWRLVGPPGTAADPEILFRGRMIRRVCSLETARSRSSTFWYYGRYGGTHVQLITQTGVKRIGFVFLRENRFNRWCWSYCKRIFSQGIIQGAFVLYPGHRIFFAADRLVAVPAGEFFGNYRPWMNACLGASHKLLLRMVRSYNSAHAGHLY